MGSAVRQLAERLFEARGRDLLRYIRLRVRGDTDASDIAQETYMRFIRLAKPEVIQNPEAYLFRMAANLISEHQLLQKKTEARRQSEYESESDEYTPQQFAVSEQVSKRVHAALESLPHGPRTAIVLHLRDGMTCAAIGTHMGISVSMVKKHLSKGLAQCRQKLQEVNR